MDYFYLGYTYIYIYRQNVLCIYIYVVGTPPLHTKAFLLNSVHVAAFVWSGMSQEYPKTLFANTVSSQEKKHEETCRLQWKAKIIRSWCIWTANIPRSIGGFFGEAFNRARRL